MSAYVGGAVSPSALSTACSHAKVVNTLQIVSYPLAAVLAGVGVYFLATSGAKPATTGWTVAPSVGRGFQGVEGALRF